jgi:Protein of unknown function, DUF488
MDPEDGRIYGDAGDNNRRPRIRVRRIYDPPDRNDGARVLVDRLWPRGARKETVELTVWLKDIAAEPRTAAMVRPRPGPLRGILPALSV